MGQGTVSKSPDQATYIYGDQVTVTATPAPGWSFGYWSGSCTGTVACVVSVDGNESVTATFVEGSNLHNLTITVDPAGGGTTTPSIGVHSYVEGTVVSVTATPSTGYVFDHWSGACTGSGPCSVTMDADKTVGATFAINTYTLTVNQPANGTITPPTATYNYGTVVTLTATPATGYHFVEWTGACTGSGTCSVTMDADKTVSAVFAINAYTLTVASDHGTVTKEPNQPTYTHGTEVLVTMGAVEAGWTFSGWSGGGCSGTAPCTVTMNSNITIAAIFSQIEYSLTITQATGGTITAVPSGPYHLNDVVTLTATPVAGYSFSVWTGNCTGQGNPCTLTMNGNKAVSATFTQNTYSLTITQATGGTISASPAGPYHLNDVVTLTATPTAGWSFTSWTGDCAGQGNPCTLTMNGNEAVSATFTQNTYSLTITQATGGTISASPAGPYHYGDQVTVTATPNAGWSFGAWTGDCAGQSNPCTLTMNGNKAVSATFTQNTYSLTITQATGGTISASPAGPYHYGDQVTVTATPNAGWSFSAWSGDLSGSTNPATITMDGNKSVTATFAYQYTLRESFDTLSGWSVKGSPKGYSAVVDTVNVYEGTGSIKLTNPTNGYVQITKSINWNLNTPATQNYIRFWVYVPDNAAMPTGGSIILSNDRGFKHYFVVNYGSGAFQFTQPGWNLITLPRSDWTIGSGSPSWTSPFVGIRISINGTTSNSYSFDQLISAAGLVP